MQPKNQSIIPLLSCLHALGININCNKFMLFYDSNQEKYFEPFFSLRLL